MEVFRVLVKICDYSDVLIGIAFLWKRKDLLSEPDDQILWNRFLASIFGVLALRTICLIVLAPGNESRFTNSIWAILSIVALYGCLKENSRSERLIEVKDNHPPLTAESNSRDHIY